MYAKSSNDYKQFLNVKTKEEAISSLENMISLYYMEKMDSNLLHELYETVHCFFEYLYFRRFIDLMPNISITPIDNNGFLVKIKEKNGKIYNLDKHWIY